ncbi:ATP-binding cassette domain-containing protein, partial [Enterocloster bolteae]|uniref:ATP-binding cassette domain-containing protein n=1 Tax=Enterocloster bolteae TaxID=208479 RepID=UPI00210B2283
GGNGAGKSTLMNVLGGLYAKDSGRILIDGREVSITDNKEAERAGIGFIHQELKLFDLRSVAENIMISNLPTKGVIMKAEYDYADEHGLVFVIDIGKCGSE